jgi:uncharacterized protein YceK
MKKLFLTAALSLMMVGCGTVAEKTNMLSDAAILSATSGVLGYASTDLDIVTRRTEGTNTYVNLKAKKDKKEFTCVIDGGNILTFGMINPPMCGKKGEPIKTNPFQ